MLLNHWVSRTEYPYRQLLQLRIRFFAGSTICHSLKARWNAFTAVNNDRTRMHLVTASSECGSQIKNVYIPVLLLHPRPLRKEKVAQAFHNSCYSRWFSSTSGLLLLSRPPNCLALAIVAATCLSRQIVTRLLRAHKSVENHQLFTWLIGIGSTLDIRLWGLRRVSELKPSQFLELWHFLGSFSRG